MDHTKEVLRLMSEKVKTWWIPIAGLVCMAISSFVAVRTANGNVVAEVICGLLMAVSISLMTWAVITTRKATMRCETIQAELEHVKSKILPSKLAIHTASWGNANPTNRKSALQALAACV